MAMLAGSLAGLQAATGTLLYNQVLSPTSPITLRRVQPDGTGDQPVLVNLPAALHPAVSRDGRRLLLTSKDPGRPFKLSQNVFILDLPTAAIGRITRFEDVLNTQGVLLTNDLGQVIGDRINSGYTINLPYHKAFSPDGTRVAVMNMRKTGTVSRDNMHSITNNPGVEGAASGRFPVVEIYRVADGQPEGSYVYLGIERTGANQGGDGVDWHPSRNEIIATLSSDIPATGNAGRTGMEGTILALFDASGSYPFLRKLTAPSGRADFFMDLSTLISTAHAEHDYAPAIAPDGTRVAYVRHTMRYDTRYDGAGIAPLPSMCSLRLVNYDGTGDREVLRLAEGLWVSQLAWAPDGSEIAFDLAPQTVLPNGWNSLSGDPTRSEIYVVRADGANPRRVAGPAAFPTWSPLSFGVEPVPPPVVGIRREGRDLELTVDNLVAGRGFEVESTIDLQNWVRELARTASGPQESVRLTPNSETLPIFFRVRIP